MKSKHPLIKITTITVLVTFFFTNTIGYSDASLIASFLTKERLFHTATRFLANALSKSELRSELRNLKPTNNYKSESQLSPRSEAERAELQRAGLPIADERRPQTNSRSELRLFRGGVQTVQTMIRRREPIFRRLWFNENPLQRYTHFMNEIYSEKWMGEFPTETHQGVFFDLLREARQTDSLDSLEFGEYDKISGKLLPMGTEKGTKIILDYYILRQIGLLALRVWDEGNPNQNLDVLQGLLDELQVGHVYVKDVMTLLAIMISNPALQESFYIKTWNNIRKLKPEYQIRFAMANAFFNGEHLQSIFEENYDGLVADSIRNRNAIDYDQLIHALDILLTRFKEVKVDPLHVEERNKIVQAILRGLGGDPEVFLENTQFLSSAHSNHPFLNHFLEVLERNRADLLEAFHQFDPSTHSFSPLQRKYVFPNRFLTDFIVALTRSDDFSDLSFEDSLFMGEEKDGDRKTRWFQTVISGENLLDPAGTQRVFEKVTLMMSQRAELRKVTLTDVIAEAEVLIRKKSSPAWQKELDELKEIRTPKKFIKFLTNRAGRPNADQTHVLRQVNSLWRGTTPQLVVFKDYSDIDSPVRTALSLSELENPGAFVQFELPNGSIVNVIYLDEDLTHNQLLRAYVHELFHVEQENKREEIFSFVKDNEARRILIEGITEFMSRNFIKENFPRASRQFVGYQLETDIIRAFIKKIGISEIIKYYESRNPDVFTENAQDTLKHFEEFISWLVDRIYAIYFPEGDEKYYKAEVFRLFYVRFFEIFGTDPLYETMEKLKKPLLNAISGRISFEDLRKTAEEIIEQLKVEQSRSELRISHSLSRLGGFSTFQNATIREIRKFPESFSRLVFARIISTLVSAAVISLGIFVFGIAHAQFLISNPVVKEKPYILQIIYAGYMFTFLLSLASGIFRDRIMDFLLRLKESKSRFWQWNIGNKTKIKLSQYINNITTVRL